MRLWTLTLLASFDTLSDNLLNFSLAVAAYLARYKFTLKTSPQSRFDPRLTEPLPEKFEIKSVEESEEWVRGVVYAEAQNFARTVRFDPGSARCS